MKTKLALWFSIMALVLIVGSLVLLCSVDWRIALGIFLFGWGSNMEKLASEYRKK